MTRTHLTRRDCLGIEIEYTGKTSTGQVERTGLLIPAAALVLCGTEIKGALPRPVGSGSIPVSR